MPIDQATLRGVAAPARGVRDGSQIPKPVLCPSPDPLPIVSVQQSPLQSLVSFRNSQGEAARGTLLKLEETTVVFEVYNPYSIVQLSEILQELTIRRGQRVIYQGRAVVSNLVNTGLMLIVSVKLLDSWSALSSVVGESDRGALQDEVERFVEDWERFNRLRAEFLLAVDTLRSFLGELSKWLAQLDFLTPSQAGCDAGSAAPPLDRLADALIPRMKRLFYELEREARAVADDEIDHHRACVQRDLHPLLLPAPFIHRTFAKPLGYAGDYEMMNMIQRNPAEGQTVYAKLINMLFLDAAIPQSVRNRTGILCQLIQGEAERVQADGGRLRVMNIGCGPAIEVRRFLSDLPPGLTCDFTLMDFNGETLGYVKERLAEIEPSWRGRAQVHLLHESVHNLLKAQSGITERTGQFDLVYCSGLFDYLSDKICSRLLRLFYSWLAPDGVLFVTNMHTSNPERRIMDLIMEWYLIYRDEVAMANLVPGLGTQRVYSDQTGVNVALEIRKV